jgi:hypothetical protein
VTIGGGLGESDIGGPVMNIVPKSGGNNLSGSAFLSTAGDWSSSNNITSELKALNPNLRDSPGIISAYDYNVSLGGPDRQGSALVLRQLPQARYVGAAGRHRRQPLCRRPDALGLGSRQ